MESIKTAFLEAEEFIQRFTLVSGHLGARPQLPKYVNHVLEIICKLSVDKLMQVSSRRERRATTSIICKQSLAVNCYC